MSEVNSSHGRTILLACDDSAARTLLDDALSRCIPRPVLRHAATAAEAIIAFEAGTDEATPSLVIASRHLPDATGAGLARRLLALLPGLPIWILDTEPAGDPAAPGEGAAAAALEALEAGALDYLTLDAATIAKLPLIAGRALSYGGSAGLPPGATAEPFRDLASIAHDLRSPLAGLVALFDLLDSEVDGPLSLSQKNRLVRIGATLERLTAVVDGIAELAQVESGRLTLASGPVDLEQVLRAAKEALDPVLRSRSLGLQIVLPPDLPPLEGDALRIRQIVVALMTGLLRQIEGTALELVASGRGPMIEVTLREASRGIPVEALSPSFGGLGDPEGGALEDPSACRGVSLSLARGLARLHGGALRIERDAAGALKASFTLPASAPAAPAPPLADAAARPDRGADLRPPA